MITAIPLKEYDTQLHKLPVAQYALQPGQVVSVTMNGKGEIIALFNKDLIEGWPVFAMGMVMFETKPFEGVLLAKKATNMKVDEVWVISQSATSGPVSIVFDGAEISGAPEFYPRESGEAGITGFNRSFIDDAMDDALKGEDGQ